MIPRQPTTPVAELAGLNLDELERLLVDQPMEVELHRYLFEKKHATGDELGALAHLIAMKALDAHQQGLREESEFANPVWQLYMVATGYFMKGDYAIAERWYHLVLMLNDEFAAVYQNMVVIHLHFGRVEQAELCRARAYQLQRIFIDPVLQPQRQLLILCVGRTKGNIPYEVLLSGETTQRIKYIIDYADPSEDVLLPPYDLVFNAIGEPDVAAPMAERLEKFVLQCNRPVINAPAMVSRTQRHQLTSLMQGLNNVVTAPCIRVDDPRLTEEAWQQRLSTVAICFPVLVRPTESHGGQGLQLCNDIATLISLELTGPQYITGFIDFQSGDGYYRKYRIVFVDKQPYAYHLAISPQWMVHYYSADMEGNQNKIAEERQFLQDPSVFLGKSCWEAILQIGQRLNLDYAGIDFTILPSGQLFIFEANATMLVHRVNNEGELAYKNAYVQRIADAFEALMVRKLH